MNTVRSVRPALARAVWGVLFGLCWACADTESSMNLAVEQQALASRVDSGLDGGIEEPALDAGQDAGVTAWDWLSGLRQAEATDEASAPAAARAPSDTACTSAVGSEACNGVDDDCDSRIDEGWTPTLFTAPQCIGDCRTRASCTNGAVRCGSPVSEVPNDSGNKDEDCTGALNDEKSAVSCSDARDNDLDGLQDCADSDCNGACVPQGGAGCSSDGQCAAGLLCVDAACRVPHCQNGTKDTEEQGIDCGGPCGPCTGLTCEHACRDGESVPPRALASLRFANGVFTRSTTATYDDSAGALRTAAVNQLRWIDANGRRLALFEGATTNLLKHSAALNDTTAWLAPSANPMTITANAELAPDGTRTAERFTSPSGPARSPRQTISMGIRTRTLSLYARATQAFEVPTLRGLATLGTPEAVTSAATWRIYDGWERLEVPIQSSNGVGFFGLSHVANWPSPSQTPISTSPFALWGAQYEEKPFPSSYIPSGASSGTRAADVLIVEPGNVPAWLRTGVWQIDVQPEFASHELLPGYDGIAYYHTLVSYGSVHVALTNGGGNQPATLVVRTAAGTQFASPALTWSRGATLRLTFDPRSAAKKVTIQGALTGDGTYDAPQLSFVSSGRVRIGGALSTNGASASGEAFAALSEPRNVSGSMEACTPDAACTCGDGTVQRGEACDPALGACDESCSIEEHTECAEDADCPNGQVCADISDRVDGEPSRNYCWPIFCADNPMAFCGTALSPCGKCDCDTSCEHAVCGARAANGCGDICYGACGEDDRGCFDNFDCRGNATCVASAEGPSRCVPAGGGIDDGSLTPDEDRECDPACEFCNQEGECLAQTPAPACPPTCRGACDLQGRCYVDGRPRPPATRDEPARATGIGQLQGNFAVGPDGVGRYTVPLALPPGRGGLAPDLALHYSTGGGDGPIAMGWSMSGLSAISVCDGKTREEGAHGPQAGPALCLGGEPLRPVFTAQGAPTQTLRSEPYYYRTRVDEGYLVEGTVDTYQGTSDLSLGARLVPGATFRLYKEDGTILTFGGDEAHLLRGAQDPLMGSGGTRKWLLASVQDPYGNRIEFRYRKRRVTFAGPSAYVPQMTGFITPAPGQTTVMREDLDAEAVVDRIAYNFDDQGVAHGEVSFIYNEEPATGSQTQRPGVHIKYWHGGPVTNRLTLDRIEMHAMGRLIRTYDLGQLTTEQGRVTLLEWLQECDYDHRGPLCFPALRFSYGDPEADDEGEMSGAADYSGMFSLSRDTYTQLTKRKETYYSRYNVVMDGNGDGVDDFFSFEVDGSLWMAAGRDRSKVIKVVAGDQFPAAFAFFGDEGVGHTTTDLPFGLQATDWNKDGLSDIVVWGLDETQFRDDKNRVYRCDNGRFGKLCGHRDPGDLSARVPYGVWVYLAKRDAQNGVAFDIERVLSETTTSDGLGLAPATGLGTQGVVLDGEPRHRGTHTNAKLALVDVNRDGMTDVVYCTTADQKGAVAIATGAHLGERWRTSFDSTARTTLPTETFRIHPVQGLDVNFCARVMSLPTRTDRTDLWDPETHTVLTKWGDGLSVFRETNFASIDLTKQDIRVAELNGDNLPDLVMHPKADKTGAFSWWFNTGSGFAPGQAIGFVPGQAVPAPLCEMKHLREAVIADFNSDGLDDFILPNCGEQDRNKVVGLAVLLARRSTEGVVQFSEPESLRSVAPGRCNNAEEWAQKDSPYAAFVGDFDGDGDQDLRVVGAEWYNGVESWNNQESNDQCSRFPTQEKCCVEDEEGESQCYINGDAWTDECDPNAPGEYNRATWKYFVQDMSNHTFRTDKSAWYLLSKVHSTAVDGKPGSELLVRYVAGTGLEAWNEEAPSEACAGLPSAHEVTRDAPNETPVYDRQKATQCGEQGVSWCSARLPNPVVSAYAARTSDGAEGWADCAEQRITYANAQRDAWNGVVGFERVTRTSRVGGELRGESVESFDLSMMPLRWARVLGERDRGLGDDGSRTPVVTYPFASRPVEVTQIETLPSGNKRIVTNTVKLAVLDVTGTSGPTNVATSTRALPDLRVLGADMRAPDWCSYWSNWCGTGQGPSQPIRVVQVATQQRVTEGTKAIRFTGGWTSHSPRGQPLEQLTWTSSTSDWPALRAAQADVRALTDVNGTRRLQATDPRTWFATAGLLEVSSSVTTPRPLSADATAWPARQAFVHLVQGMETATFGAGTSTTTPDKRHAATMLGYDTKGQVDTISREVDSGEMHQRIIHRDTHGFVTGIEEFANMDCEPSCAKTTAIVPDALGLFAESVTDAGGLVRTASYDYGTGLPIRVQAPDGVTQRTLYDAAGRVEETYVEGLASRSYVTRFPVSPVEISSDDTEGALTARGHFAETVIHRNLTTNTIESVATRWYDAAGREVRASQTGLLGALVWSETAYDLRGRAVRTTRPHTEPFQASQGTVRSAYDAVDRLVRTTTPSPRGVGDAWVEYTYASQGDPNGVAVSWLAQPSVATVVVQTTSEQDHAKFVSAQDAMGRTVSSTQAPAAGAPAATTTVWGVGGVPLLIRGPDRDLLGRRYDALGRIVEQTSSESGTQTYAYDGFGRLRTATDNGTSRGMTYDALDRPLEEEVSSDLEQGGPLVTRWEWDRTEQERIANAAGAPQNRGKLMEILRSDGFTQRHSYEGTLHQLDSMRRTVARLGGAGAVDLVVGYTYDAHGRLETTHYPGGYSRAQRLHYNAFGQVGAITSSGTGRPDQTVWKLTEAHQGQRFRKVEVAGQRLLETRDYESGSSLLKSLDSKLDGTTVQHDVLSRDDLGRVVRRESLTEPKVSTFDYDPFGRLEVRYHGDAAPQNEVERFTYSLGGRLNTTRDATLTYRTDGVLSTAVQALTARNGDDALGYRYVPTYGLMKSIQGTWHSRAVDVELDYDASRRVRRMVGEEGEVRFLYDAQGARAARRVERIDGDTSFTAYAGKLYERQERADGTLAHVFRFTDGAGQVVVEETLEEAAPGGTPSTTSRVLVRDYQGSVLGTVAPNEQPELRGFTSFGSPSDALAATELGYTGHRSLVDGLDFGIELVDMGGRVYDPNAAQFLQPDPTFPNLGHPQGFNRRSYVHNDPINHLDPSGYQCDSDDGGDDCADGALDFATALYEGGKRAYNWARNPIKEAWTKFWWKRADDQRKESAETRFKDGPLAAPSPSAAPLGEGSDRSSAVERGPENITYRPTDSGVVTSRPVDGEEEIEIHIPGTVQFVPIWGPIRGFDATLNAGFDALLAGDELAATQMFGLAGLNGAIALFDGVTLGAGGVVSTPIRLGMEGGLNAARGTTTSTALRSAESSVAATAAHPTFVPGPFAGESIPAASTSQRFTVPERTATNRIGYDTGCHSCGATVPGTKSGNYVPDHQPPSALAPEGTSQRLYPHCIQCSREQGLAIARLKRGQ